MNRTTKIIAGIGITIAAIGGVTTGYYFKENKCIHGRQINQCLTSYEFNSLVKQMKTKVKNGDLSLNEIFVVEDIINYRCSQKLAMGLNSTAIINLLSGKCNP